MKKTIIVLGASILILLLSAELKNSQAQSSAQFIYGAVTTTANHTFTGPIRWGTEEVLWSDIFNSTKSGNDYLPYFSHLNNNKIVVIEDARSGELLNIEVDRTFMQIHTFECQFGDISSLEVISNSRVDLQMKNNFVYRLKNGSNDVGATIRIMDEKNGLVKISWDEVKKVEFMDSPADMPDRFGDPLSGTVYTAESEYSGQIEWDQDERLTTDVLNGDRDGEDLGIPFGTIHSIIKLQDGSKVVMVTGEEFILTGSNDVNSENRGIAVTVEGIGRIMIPWEQFIKVTFNPTIRYEGPSYHDFEVAESLRGAVFTTTGEALWGGIVYDLDEAFDTEFLQGKSMETEYQIPFRNISSIMPLDDRSSLILLTGGEKLTLGSMQDVTRANDGILIIGDDSPLIKIGWEEVLEVRFK